MKVNVVALELWAFLTCVGFMIGTLLGVSQLNCAVGGLTIGLGLSLFVDLVFK